MRMTHLNHEEFAIWLTDFVNCFNAGNFKMYTRKPYLSRMKNLIRGVRVNEMRVFLSSVRSVDKEPKGGSSNFLAEWYLKNVEVEVSVHKRKYLLILIDKRHKNHMIWLQMEKGEIKKDDKRDTFRFDLGRGINGLIAL